jgi:hypothetical protein
MTCQQCSNAMSSHYQLNHINTTGAVDGTVSVCSLICVVRFAYSYGTQRGAMGAMAIKQTVTQLLAALKGPPRT